MSDTTKTAREELQALFAKRAENGMVDVKFYMKNLEEAAPQSVYQEVLHLYTALERGDCSKLEFRDSYRG